MLPALAPDGLCYDLYDLWTYGEVDEKTKESLPLAGSLAQYYWELDAAGFSEGRFTESQLRGEYVSPVSR